MEPRKGWVLHQQPISKPDVPLLKAVFPTDPRYARVRQEGYPKSRRLTEAAVAVEETHPLHEIECTSDCSIGKVLIRSRTIKEFGEA